MGGKSIRIEAAAGPAAGFHEVRPFMTKGGIRLKALVLGCGLIGSTIALDLSADLDVTVMDPSEKSLDWIRKRADVKAIQASAADFDMLDEAAAAADITCVALPCAFEGPVMRRLIETGKNFCSPSGYLNGEGLDDLAKKHGVTAVFDMGVAPGMSNYLVARGAALLDELDEGRIYVGGIPDRLDPPFNYRTVFCLADTLTEYVFPAHHVENGRKVAAEALSGLEHVEFPGLGTLEAFFTDGLRSGADNIKGRVVFEKTLRYPGYAEQMKLLRHMGLFDAEPVEVDGVKVSPRAVASALLGPLWTLAPEKGEADLTVMRVIAKGPKCGDTVTHTWELFDRLDEKTGIHSMARTTAFPCTITARAIADGTIRKAGFVAPEMLADNEAFYGMLMSGLRVRGVKFSETTCVTRS